MNAAAAGFQEKHPDVQVSVPLRHRLVDEALTRRELTDRLVAEYGDAQPPGRVLSAVLRADHAIPATRDDDHVDRVARCESLARILLAGA